MGQRALVLAVVGLIGCRGPDTTAPEPPALHELPEGTELRVVTGFVTAVDRPGGTVDIQARTYRASPGLVRRLSRGHPVQLQYVVLDGERWILNRDLRVPMDVPGVRAGVGAR